MTRRAEHWKPILVSLASASLAFAVVMVISDISDRSDRETEDRATQTRAALLEGHGDVRPAADYGPVPSEIDLGEVISQRRNLRGMFHAGRSEWLDTLVHLDDPGFVADERLSCSAVHATEISSCFYRFTLVIRPSGDGQGEIAHVATELVDPAESPNPADRNDPGCLEFAECLGKIRIGQAIPIPPGQEEWFALEELYQATDRNEPLFRSEKVRAMIERFDAAALWHQDLPERSPEEELRMRNIINTAQYLRIHLVRLEEAEQQHAP